MFSNILGHLHPVLVHLPIGILLLACFFQWLTIKDRYVFLQPAIPVTLFWGMLSAIASCITGYLLSGTGDYDEVLVGRHQWMGIAVAILSVLLYIGYQVSVNDRIARWSSLLLIILIVITGHLGGSLTHGAGYLTEGLDNVVVKGPAIKPIPNVPEAVLYADAIQPLLQARCYSCHGPNKKKGKLRLDSPDFILQGGEDGKALVPGKPDEGEMMKRLLMPLNNKDHMPPLEKPQLTPNEIELLNWWVSNGADFTKKIKDLPATPKIIPVLMALQKGAATGNDSKQDDVPIQPVTKANDTVLAELKRAGVVIVPVAQNSNYLSASFVSVIVPADSLVHLLKTLKDQLIWLNLGNSGISNREMEGVAKLDRLTRLYLNNTAITDSGLNRLSNAKHLHYLNLVNTKITAAGLASLKQLKELKSIYLYHSAITKDDWAGLLHLFPAATLDSGGYTIPLLATDTTEVKDVKKEKK